MNNDFIIQLKQMVYNQRNACHAIQFMTSSFFLHIPATAAAFFLSPALAAAGVPADKTRCGGRQGALSAMLPGVLNRRGKVTKNS
jgi:hypothetical protein